MDHSMGKGLRLITALFIFFTASELRAETPEFRYRPEHLGAALLQGGWMLERTLAISNGSPEFTFPLQLVYLSTRTQRGIFGDQWFCPQLESNILPKGPRVLLWQTPGGDALPFFADQKKAGLFQDKSGKWQAQIQGDKIWIKNSEGWRFDYVAGHLISLTSPTGRVLEFSYKGSVPKEVRLRDPLTNATRTLVLTTYDSKDQLQTLTVCGLQHCFTYERTGDNRLISWARPGQIQPDQFNYGKIGELASIQPAFGEKIIFTTKFMPPLDAGGKRTQSQQEEKKVANYRLIDDGTYKYTYGDSTGGRSKYRAYMASAATSITIENRQGVKQSLGFDQKAGARISKNADGSAEKLVYFLAPDKKYNGKLRRIERNEVIVAEYRYDEKTGLLAESRDQNGISTFFTYPAAQKPGTALYDKPILIERGSLKAREVIASMKYDAGGRLIEKTESGGKTTKINYNARGELESLIDPSGIRTTFTQDSFGRESAVVRGDQRQTVDYDDNGRVRSKKSLDGQLTEYVYDPSGNVAVIKQNGISVVTYQYDKNGLLTGQSDASGRATKIERDIHGKVLAEHQPNGSITSYEYDAEGHRTAQIDGKGNRITFKYDAGGRLIEQKNPLGQMLTWTYDEQGRLVARTNGVQKVRNIYNDKGRLKMIDYGVPGEKIVYSYDEKGRVKKVATPTNSVSLYYDEMNRIVGRQLTRGDIQRVVRYAWDTAGHKTSVVLSEKLPGTTQPNNYKLLQQTDYAYDANGRLVEIKSNGASVCRYQYDAKGLLISRQFGNGIVARYAYDVFRRQTRLDLSGGPLTESLLLAYQWDNAGQLLSRTWNGETQVYTYDPSGQLLTVSKAGTPPSQQITKVANNQPLTILESYRYDLAGNMLAKFENGDTTVMSYDPANQLVSAVTGGKTTAFKYDAAGRLLSQTTDGQTQTRAYGFLDKVLVLTKPDGTRIGFDYYPDGQLAAKAPLPAADLNALPQASGKKQTVGSMISNLLGAKPEEEPLEANPEQAALNRNLREELVWDGLALLYRSGVSYAVEPHVSGGVPLTATQGAGAPPVYYINDILGTTLAVVSPDRVEIAPMTAFGKPRCGSGAPSAIPDPAIAAPPFPGTNSPAQQNPLVPVKGQN